MGDRQFKTITTSLALSPATLDRLRKAYPEARIVTGPQATPEE